MLAASTVELCRQLFMMQPSVTASSAAISGSDKHCWAAVIAQASSGLWLGYAPGLF